MKKFAFVRALVAWRAGIRLRLGGQTCGSGNATMAVDSTEIYPPEGATAGIRQVA